MLLNNEIKIEVTNNGKDNNLTLSLDPHQKFSDIMKCIQMASDTLRNTLEEYIKNKGGVTDKELKNLLKNITLEEIYATK